jgi:hypothetical protein
MDAMTETVRVAATQDGVITAEQALCAGLSRTEIRDLCRSGRWHRLARGTYFVGGNAGHMPRRAEIRAAVLSLGPGAIAVLHTAAELFGIAGLRRTDEIHVSVPIDHPRPQRIHEGLVLHQLTIPAAHRGAVGGIPVTTPVWSVSDLLLRVDRYTGVCLLDSALNRGLISGPELAGIPVLIRGRRGAVAARRCLAEADGRAQSPLETRVRLRCVDGRVPPDALQVNVRDEDGYLLGVGDLGWLGPRVIAEADGVGPHGTARALFEDRQRQNLFMNAGWIVLRFTWADAMRPDYIPFVVRQALRARAHSR